MNSTVFNSKNKFVILIIAVILIIPAIFAVYFSTNIDTNVSSSRVTGIDITNVYGITLNLSDEKDFVFYADAIKNAKLIDENFRDLSSENPYTVTFVENDGNTTEYKFYMVNSADGCIYIDSESNYYLFSEKDAQKMLSRDEFISVNSYATIPFALITGTSSIVNIQPSGGTWNYHEADGSYTEKQIEMAQNQPVFKINANSAGTLSFASAVQPDSVTVTLSKDGIIRHEGAYENILNANVMSANDVYYDIVINAEWLQEQGCDFYGKVSYSAKVLYDVSPTYTMIYNAKVSKGDFTVIKMQNFNDGDKLFAKSTFPVPEELSVFKSAAGYSFAFLPAEFTKLSPSGRYTLELSLEDGSTQTLAFSVSDGRQPGEAVALQEMLIIDQTLQASFSAEAFEEFNNVIAEKTAVTSQTPLWEGKFVYPDSANKGAIGTGMAHFGTVRSVGGLYQKEYTHTAIDIAANAGDNVLASNHGKVVFAGELKLTGNTVIIDHGCSIFSYYGHLETIGVAEGDSVSKSDVIGTAGSTGFAAAKDGASCNKASQIHFATSIEGVFVNPYYLCKVGVSFDD